MQKIMVMLFTTILGYGCEIKINTEKGSSRIETKTVSTLKEQNGTEISNDIELKTTGIKVKRVFLMLENGERAPDDNVIKLGQKIQLVFYIEEGWTVENGNSYIGASQKIITDNGRVVLNMEDIFADYSNTGFPAKACKSVNLDVVITKTDSQTNYYITQFRVWDKRGTGEISGSYKFYIKQ